MKKVTGIGILAGIFLLMALLSGCAGRKEPVTLRYAAWNLGPADKDGLERRMVRAFTEKYPYIKVEIEENFAKNYDDAMKKASAGKNLPDVFMYAGNPQADANGWCADLTEIAGRDAEWRNIPVSLRESAKVKGRIIAVPCSMYFFGYFFNKDLAKSKGVELSPADWTVSRFERAVSEMADIPGGTIGLADESSIIEWYPAAAAKNFGWFSWDGGRFNLNSKEFINGVKLARCINQKHQSCALLPEEEKRKLKGANDWEAWNAGTVALKFDGTWAVESYSKLPFKVGFLGIPGGRTCIVPDFLFVSRTCGHPEEAYLFAKYLSAYSPEGFSRRMEIAEAGNFSVTTLPMLKNRKVIDTYFSFIKIEGIRECFNLLDRNSYVEGTKILPGYKQARWEYVTNLKAGDKENAAMGDVISSTFRGGGNIDELAGSLNSAANECVGIFPKPVEN